MVGHIMDSIKLIKLLNKVELSNEALIKHQEIWQMSDIELKSSIIY